MICRHCGRREATYFTDACRRCLAGSTPRWLMEILGEAALQGLALLLLPVYIVAVVSILVAPVVIALYMLGIIP